MKKEIQDYQKEKFPELCNSVVEHDRKSKPGLSKNEYQFKLRTRRETDKEKVLSILKTCIKKASSKENYYELLGDSNLDTYQRGGQTTGFIYNGQKFRFKRLGFTEERFEDLEKVGTRERSLSDVRETTWTKDRTTHER